MGLDITFNKRKRTHLGYFRKVNFLVRYFKSLGFDPNKSDSFEISKTDIKDLLFRCKEVLKDPSIAGELLPTMGGFFFGSIEYDEYYYEDVEEVKKFIEETLLPSFDNLQDDEYITFDIWY